MTTYEAFKSDLLKLDSYRDEDLHRRFRAVVSTIPAGSRVLDVACGSGTLMAALRAKGCAVSGFDLTPPAVALARSKGLHVFQGDADAFDTDPTVREALFADLDVIVFSKCLMYLRRKGELFAALRVPRILAIQTNPLRWKTRLRNWRGHYPAPENPYITADGKVVDENTLAGLQQWGESHGYRTRILFGGFFSPRDAIIEFSR